MPFGPGTDRPRRQPDPERPGPSDGPRPPAAAELPEPDAPPGAGAALRPEDFWEGAAIQEVVGGPVEPAAAQPRIASASTALARPLAAARVAARQLLASRPVLIVACAIAGICVVVLGVSPDTHSASRRPTRTHHASPDHRPIDAALLPSSISHLRIRPAPADRRLHSAGARKPAQRPEHASGEPSVATDYTPAPSAPAVTSSAASNTTTVADRSSAPAPSPTDYQSQPPAQQTPAQQNTSSGTSDSSGSGASASNSSSGASGSANSGSSSAPVQTAAQTSNAPSQPVRPFGQNGPLGPGSSPNG